MPLPLFLAAGAIIAGAGGVGLGIHGGVKMKKANDKMTQAQKRDERNQSRLKRDNMSACGAMDTLGKHEMKIIASFKDFSALFEKIKNRPHFDEIKHDGKVNIEFHPKEIKEASVGASVLVGGLGGAALGTAGGFAASGATTAAVMALGTASTGTAISSLGGVAATNATLAALGGGSLAAGGGGIALGTTLLGAASLGVGLLIGGAIFSLSGSSISGKADKAWDQMLENERKIDKICYYLYDLSTIAKQYDRTLTRVNTIYQIELVKMRSIVNSHLQDGHADWNQFNDEEKTVIQNTILLVGVLYQMCKVNIVQKSESEDGQNKINYKMINEARDNGEKVYKQMKEAA